LTNSPIFEKQLALDACWKDICGTVMPPRPNRSADRFVLASFYINATKQSGDTRQAVADVLSVMRNVSVPHGNFTPGQPNLIHPSAHHRRPEKPHLLLREHLQPQPHLRPNK